MKLNKVRQILFVLLTFSLLPFFSNAQCAAPAPYPSSDLCYLQVINSDPFCCNNTWDNICENSYQACTPPPPPPGGTGGCNTNISICDNNSLAGPFGFNVGSANPSSCLDYLNGVNAPNYAYVILLGYQARS